MRNTDLELRTAVRRELVQIQVPVLQATGVTVELTVLEVPAHVLHNYILEEIEKLNRKLKVSHAVSRGRLHCVGGANA